MQHAFACGNSWKPIEPTPALTPEASDPINHPGHYTSVVPGIECIQVTEHMSFLRGNAIKYLWRAGAKGDVVEDLKKAVWYIQREIDSIGRSGGEDLSKVAE